MLDMGMRICHEVAISEYPWVLNPRKSVRKISREAVELSDK